MGLSFSHPLQIPIEQVLFLHTKGHKTYVVTAPGCDWVKVGYTSQDISKGVWRAYRRAYGQDLEIIAMYPAQSFKEDEKIHKLMHPQYGHPAKGREIYQKKYLSQVLSFLSKYHSCRGYGPYIHFDIKKLRKLNKISEKNKQETDSLEVVIADLNFLKI